MNDHHECIRLCPHLSMKRSQFVLSTYYIMIIRLKVGIKVREWKREFSFFLVNVEIMSRASVKVNNL